MTFTMTFTAISVEPAKTAEEKKAFLAEKGFVFQTGQITSQMPRLLLPLEKKAARIKKNTFLVTESFSSNLHVC